MSRIHICIIKARGENRLANSKHPANLKIMIFFLHSPKFATWLPKDHNKMSLLNIYYFCFGVRKSKPSSLY